ncbi:MAG: glycerophosphodiester phosphodiesterase [Burkholderiaceae bacterium]|jgi:glycerophosphoryl diester phosphodiesterase
MRTTTAAWPYSSLIAHRGAGRYAPENTLAAIRLGARHHFTMMEYDVKLTRDGILVLLHDDTLDRTSNLKGRAADSGYLELAQGDFGQWHSRDYAGEPIPTLYSIARYTQANGIDSNIEIKPSKGYETETGTAVALAARQLWEASITKPLLSSFSELALAAARQAAPELPRALLIGREIPANWRDRVTELQCIGLNVNDKYLDEATANDILQAGYTLAVYTVNNPARARELLSWGCHGVFTDEIMTISPLHFS